MPFSRKILFSSSGNLLALSFMLATSTSSDKSNIMIPTHKSTPPYAFYNLLFIAGMFAFKWFVTTQVFSGTLALSRDEAQYWVWSQNLEWGYFSKPPLLAYFIRFFTLLLGDSEVALKTISNLFYSASAWIVFLLARRMYSPPVGFMAAIVCTTMPAAVYGSIALSTDAPCIFFWTLSLLFFYRAIHENKIWLWILLGLSLGCCIMSKYAGVYFFLCSLVYLITNERQTWQKYRKGLILAFLLSFIVVLPNIYWNWQNAFITCQHVLHDNIRIHKQKYSLFSVLIFVVGQLGIFGFINSWAIFKGIKIKEKTKNTTFILSFSLPVLLLITLQAFMSRADLHWAALSFITLSILAGYAFYQFPRKKQWITASILTCVMPFALLSALPERLCNCKDSLLRKELRAGIHYKKAFEHLLQTGNKCTLLCSSRRACALSLYYLRHISCHLECFNPSNITRHYFHMRHPFTQQDEYTTITYHPIIPPGYTLKNKEAYTCPNCSKVTIICKIKKR